MVFQFKFSICFDFISRVDHKFELIDGINTFVDLESNKMNIFHLKRRNKVRNIQ